jgi:hypothetical protein
LPDNPPPNLFFLISIFSNFKEFSRPGSSFFIQAFPILIESIIAAFVIGRSGTNFGHGQRIEVIMCILNSFQSQVVKRMYNSKLVVLRAQHALLGRVLPFVVLGHRQTG